MEMRYCLQLNIFACQINEHPLGICVKLFCPIPRDSCQYQVNTSMLCLIQGESWSRRSCHSRNSLTLLGSQFVLGESHKNPEWNGRPTFFAQATTLSRTVSFSNMLNRIDCYLTLLVMGGGGDSEYY